jgi:linearmycin/streptolysin S transport system permease protein
MRVQDSGREAIALAGTGLLRATLLIAGKELRQRLRDRSALVIAFLAPFLLASIIGLAFGSDFTFRATYAVADDDRGPLTAGLVDGVLASPGLREAITVRRVDAVEARALVHRGDADAAFLLPAGFSASVQRGGSATLTVLQSGDSPIAAQVARSLADAYVANLTATQLAVRTAIDASGTTPPTGTAAARLGERAAAAGRLPVQLTEGRVGTREIQAVNYFGNGVLSLIVRILQGSAFAYSSKPVSRAGP